MCCCSLHPSCVKTPVGIRTGVVPTLVGVYAINSRVFCTSENGVTNLMARRRSFHRLRLFFVCLQKRVCRSRKSTLLVSSLYYVPKRAYDGWEYIGNQFPTNNVVAECILVRILQVPRSCVRLLGTRAGRQRSRCMVRRTLQNP